MDFRHRYPSAKTTVVFIENLRFQAETKPAARVGKGEQKHCAVQGGDHGLYLRSFSVGA